jgi:group I intron endonuclease
VTHKDSGKLYIGWTNDFVKRQRQHLKKARLGSSCYFHRALAKHGFKAFKWEIIQYFDTPEEAKQAEIFWISYLNTNHCRNGYGYNSTDGGDGALGARHTAEHRLHLSQHSIAKRPEVRAKMKATRLAMGENHPSKREWFKKRMSGSCNPAAKLTNEQTEIIKYSNETCSLLAKRYNISKSRISEIKKGA